MLTTNGGNIWIPKTVGSGGKLGVNYINNKIIIQDSAINKIYISENIDIDNNNNIYIKNEHVKFVECSIRCTILDANFASPIIKYIGVISR